MNENWLKEVRETKEVLLNSEPSIVNANNLSVMDHLLDKYGNDTQETKTPLKTAKNDVKQGVIECDEHLIKLNEEIKDFYQSLETFENDRLQKSKDKIEEELSIMLNELNDVIFDLRAKAQVSNNASNIFRNWYDEMSQRI